MLSAAESTAYIEMIVSEQPPVRWWAEQVLYDERKRKGTSSDLDDAIKARLQAGDGTEELELGS